MTAFLAVLNHWRPLLIVFAAIAMASLYYIGKRDGRSEVAVKAAAEISEAWKQRGQIDGESQNTSAVNTCITLGGLHDECKQLRRLDRKPRSK